MPAPAPAPAADRATVAAIALVAGALTLMLHEAVGHGGACWLSGGHSLLISSVSEQCSVASPWIAAAGTLVNLAAGLICFLLARRVRGSAHWRLLLWTTMAFNWLAAAGYWIFSGVANIGDWAAVLAGLQPAWLWHAGLTALGACAYVFFVRLITRELKPFLPLDATCRARHARRTMLTAYFSFGVLSCAAGLLNPGGLGLVLISAAAGSFGGASGLCWGWKLAHSPFFAQPGPRMPPLTRRNGWLRAGSIAAVLIIFLGVGIRP